jgi:hypothetical protein
MGEIEIFYQNKDLLSIFSKLPDLDSIQKAFDDIKYLTSLQD